MTNASTQELISPSAPNKKPTQVTCAITSITIMLHLSPFNPTLPLQGSSFVFPNITSLFRFCFVYRALSSFSPCPLLPCPYCTHGTRHAPWSSWPVQKLRRSIRARKFNIKLQETNPICPGAYLLHKLPGAVGSVRIVQKSQKNGPAVKIS